MTAIGPSHGIPLDRGDQTDLPEPVKIDWTGYLRSRVGERHWDYAATKKDGEWVVADDADPYSAATYRALNRLKTKVVLETAEEAYSFYGTMAHYTEAGKHGVTWLNPMGAKAARRLRSEVLEKLNSLEGVEAERAGSVHCEIEIEDG